MVNVELGGTDLEVVAYVNAAGNLVIRVNKAGVCVADVGIANATAEFSAVELMNIGTLMRPVLRDLKRANVVELLAEHASRAWPRRWRRSRA